MIRHMGVRIRQLVLVAESLESVVDDLCAVFDLEVSYRDPGVAAFGLVNAVMPVGDTFLEVVSPVKPDASAARFLERRGGDGGYMVIVQVEDLDVARKHMSDLGVRIVFEQVLDDIGTLHLHPRDVGGAILSLDAADPPSSWRWAGPDWESHRRTERTHWLTGAELQSRDPEAMARRWSEVVGQALVERTDGRLEIPLDAGDLRFVPDRDGRGEGLAAIEVRVADPAEVCAVAADRGIEVGDGFVRIGGVRFDLVS